MRQKHGDWVRKTLEQYEARLLAYARRLTGDSETARDVVQDVFMRLCSQDPARLNGRLAPWLYTVCRNRSLDVRERETRRHIAPAESDHFQANGSAPPDALVCANEAHAIVLATILKLPEQEQEAVRLKFEHGLTYREIAEVMDLPLGTVSNRIASAMTKLRERLTPLLSNEPSERISS